MEESSNSAYMNESNLYPSISILTVLEDFEKQTNGIDILVNDSSNFDI